MDKSWLGLAMEDPAGWLGYFEGNLVSFLQSQEQVNEFLQNTEPVGQVFPVYTNPQKKEWVGLTKNELAEILCNERYQFRTELMLLAAQEKLKEKNA